MSENDTWAERQRLLAQLEGLQTLRADLERKEIKVHRELAELAAFSLQCRERLVELQ